MRRSTTRPVYTCASTSPCLICYCSGTRNTSKMRWGLDSGWLRLGPRWPRGCVSPQLACTVIAGLLHFLVIASFVWMLLEALQLHLLVRRLTKVQVIQRDGLPRPLLYLVGYGVPFTIVGVSALVYSDGYGATEAKMWVVRVKGDCLSLLHLDHNPVFASFPCRCWLSQRQKFNWALTGPVIAILGVSYTHPRTPPPFPAPGFL